MLKLFITFFGTFIANHIAHLPDFKNIGAFFSLTAFCTFFLFELIDFAVNILINKKTEALRLQRSTIGKENCLAIFLKKSKGFLDLGPFNNIKIEKSIVNNQSHIEIVPGTDFRCFNLPIRAPMYINTYTMESLTIKRGVINYSPLYKIFYALLVSWRIFYFSFSAFEKLSDVLNHPIGFLLVFLLAILEAVNRIWLLVIYFDIVNYDLFLPDYQYLPVRRSFYIKCIQHYVLIKHGLRMVDADVCAPAAVRNKFRAGISAILRANNITVGYNADLKRYGPFAREFAKGFANYAKEMKKINPGDLTAGIPFLNDEYTDEDVKEPGSELPVKRRVDYKTRMLDIESQMCKKTTKVMVRGNPHRKGLLCVTNPLKAQFKTTLHLDMKEGAFNGNIQRMVDKMFVTAASLGKKTGSITFQEIIAAKANRVKNAVGGDDESLSINKKIYKDKIKKQMSAIKFMAVYSKYESLQPKMDTFFSRYIYFENWPRSSKVKKEVAEQFLPFL